MRTYEPIVTRPPNVRAILRWVLDPIQCENLEGDLEEIFYTVVLPERGPKGAKAWYWVMTTKSLLPLICDSMLMECRREATMSPGMRFFE